MKSKLYIKFLIVYTTFLAAGWAFYALVFRRLVYYALSIEEITKAGAVDVMQFGAGMLISIDIISLIIPVCFYFLCHKPLHDTAALCDFFLGRGDHYQPGKTSTNEFQQLQADISFMAREARQELELQQTALANISHDFRSPLTSIRGYTQAMLDGTIPPENREKYLQLILEMSDRLTDLAGDIVTVSRSAQVTMALYITSFDINEVIFSIASSIELQCREKNLHLILNLEDSPLLVSADRDKIMQVITNLLDNAIKFSAPDKDLYVRTRSDDDTVFISVKDFGSVIPAGEQSKIWHRYYKVDSSRSPESRGSGIGLAIVKQIVSMHGQNVSFTSSEEDGTEFTFTLHRTMTEA